MVDVLHHVTSPELFFAEAVRCLKPGGRLLLIEPWINGWSRLIYFAPSPRAARPRRGLDDSRGRTR